MASPGFSLNLVAQQLQQQQLQQQVQQQQHLQQQQLQQLISQCFRQEALNKISSDRNSKARKSLGTLMLIRSQYEEAYQHLRRSLELQPIQLGVWFNAGFCAWKTEKYVDAATCYHRCVSLEPEHFEAWNNLSAAYIRQGQKERARRILQEALKYNFEHANVWENYLLLCVDTGEFNAERQSLELVCRRMYLLSQQTPFKGSENLHLFLEKAICSDDKPTSFKIFLKTHDPLRNRLEKIKNSTQIFSFNDIQILESYLLRCHSNITKVTINGIIETKVFEIFDFYLKKVEEFNCINFNKDLVDIILISGQTFTKRIKILRLPELDIPENCDFLAPFPNLQKLYLEENRCSRNLSFSLRRRRSKLELISLKEDRKYEDLEEEWNLHGNHVLDELELYSEKIEFENLRNYSTNPHHFNISLKFENLTSFEVSLSGFDYREVRTVLESICFMNLERLSLKDVHFNSRTLEFEEEFKSKSTLKELTLENWISLDDSFVDLERLLSQSVEILKLRQLDITRYNFSKWAYQQKCPNLKELEFFPLTVAKSTNDLVRRSVTFYSFAKFLRKLERITSSVPIPAGVIHGSILDPRMRISFKNLKEINFVLYTSDRSKLEKMLQNFYGKDKNGSEYYIGPTEIDPDFPTITCGFHRMTLTFGPHTIDKPLGNFRSIQCEIPNCGCVLSRV